MSGERKYRAYHPTLVEDERSPGRQMLFRLDCSISPDILNSIQKYLEAEGVSVQGILTPEDANTFSLNVSGVGAHEVERILNLTLAQLVERHPIEPYGKILGRRPFKNKVTFVQAPIVFRGREQSQNVVRVEESIPVDTILSVLPHWTVVSGLKFSSLETLVLQLKQWKIPFQVVKYSRGQEHLERLNSESQDEPQINILFQRPDTNKAESAGIIKRSRDWARYDDEEESDVLIFGIAFGLSDKGKMVYDRYAKDPQPKEVVCLNPEANEIIFPTQVVVEIPYPERVEKSLKIQEYTFELSPEQQKMVSEWNIDGETQEGFGNTFRRLLRLHIEFPVENPNTPILKKIEKIRSSDNFKPDNRF